MLLIATGLRAAEPTPAALAKVWTDMRMGRWDAAVEGLAPLIASPNVGTVCQARFAEGNLWQHRQPDADLDKARAAYRWIVTTHPRNAVAPWAALALARIPDLDVLQPDPAAAIPLYRQVMTDYPTSAAAQEAALHLAEALFTTRGKAGGAEAVALLEKLQHDQPQPAYATEIELLLGKLYRYPLLDYRASVTHLQKALELGLETQTQQMKVCWTIAELADRELQDRDLAVTFYTRYLKAYPRDMARFRAKQALARLGAPVPSSDDAAEETAVRQR
jgi:tetratricopeptide (TPR) repeat protein